jgi:hypothetical protein
VIGPSSGGGYLIPVPGRTPTFVNPR